MRQHALQGLRVIDFSWVVAGPMATKMMAAMGAEVIKIESSLRPEFSNRRGYFPILNNGKRSCTVDIRLPAGQDLLRRLVAISDVMVENFSTPVLRKYGLSYDEMRKVRPDLIYCSASGVGRTGPQRDVLAYGTLLQGYSGRASLVGEINPDLDAMGIVPAWTDPATAMWEVLAILAAVRHRRRTGEGALIDLSMLEATVALLPQSLLSFGLGEDEPVSTGNEECDAAPGGCFPCAGDEEWLALSVRSDEEWQALCAVMGRDDLSASGHHAQAAQRLADKGWLNREVGAWLVDLDATEAEARLQAAGVPASRSRSMLDLLQEPGPAERGLFPEMADGARTIALPWQDESGWRGTLGAVPTLGGDNDYVFGELLGLSREQIGRLVDVGVIR